MMEADATVVSFLPRLKMNLHHAAIQYSPRKIAPFAKSYSIWDRIPSFHLTDNPRGAPVLRQGTICWLKGSVYPAAWSEISGGYGSGVRDTVLVH